MADVLFDGVERSEIINISRAVWLETVNEIRSIYVNYALFTQYPVSDEISERYAIVNLARSKVVSQRELAQAFDCHFNTINRYLQAYDENSLEGLIRKIPGPKGPTTPWKITPPIRDYIWELVAAEPGLTQQAVANRIEETFQVTIHRAGVGRALSAYRQQQRQTKPESVQLSIEEDSLSPVVTENEGVPALPIELEETEHLVIDLQIEEDELPIHSCSAQAEEALISRLTKGMDSRYGAALILNPFLQKLNLIPILEQSVLAQKDTCADKVKTMASTLQELLNPERLYNLAQMYLTLVYLIVFRFPSIEAFKLVDRKSFGQLVGTIKAPVVKTLRRFLEGVTALETSGTVAIKLARQYVKLDIVQLGILYLDGHFVPYYGKSQIAKGYFTTRRLALKGNHHYFANDLKGRPIFFRLTSAAIQFTDIIPDMVKDAQELMAENGTQSPLIVVFDRGGYDSKLFQTLDQMGVIYITWRKRDQPISHELFTHIIYDERVKEGEEPQIKYHAYRRNILVGQEKYEAEAISFFAPDEEDDHHSTLVTNAFKFTAETHPGFAPRTTTQIIHDLINRWKQENFFKAAKHGYRIDYNPSYGVHELEEQPLVKNPRIREFNTQISSLKKKLQQSQQLIADKFLNSRSNDKPLSHYQNLKSYQKLVEQKEGLEEEIKTLVAKKDVEPTRILYQEAKPGQERVALNLERKYLLDNIKIATYNLNEMLLDVFAGCYDDPKDIRQILQMIIERGAHLRLVDGTLQVTIYSMDLPKYQRAAEKLCNKLNELDPVTLDKNQFPIFYRVSSKE